MFDLLLLKGPPGGVGFTAPPPAVVVVAGAGAGAGARGAEFDFERAADLVVGGFEGDLLGGETAFGAGKVVAAVFDDAGLGLDGFAIDPVAVFDDGFEAVGALGGAAAISFLAPSPGPPISFFFFTTLPPPRIGYGIFAAPPPPPPTPSSPKGLFAVGTLGPGAFV